MWPWGHLAFAYLTYRGWSHLRGRAAIAGGTLGVLVLGALAPDLVDKPLAWTLSILPSGRSLAHSLLTAGALGAGSVLLLRNPGRRRQAGVFLFGYVGHIVADAVPDLVAGDPEALFFWNWPFAPHPTLSNDYSFVGQLFELGDQLRLLVAGEFSALGWVGIELVFVLVVGLLWLFDGAPGCRCLKLDRHRH
ncbi:metal-dependent hydrolase [Halodesulfurarchaeum formicicum]|uniref:metal-dependent hydrolase n=1 Tax=Halodesulfurarchaeum formicicum TaxID=1873524 RepID=UPI000903387C|nr:metal-dependent hydrolase [Halodesulfurarchaeum formicicum]